MRYDGKKEPYKWTWPKVVIFGVVVGVVFLFGPVIASHASVRQDWGVTAVQNYHYDIQEYRSGLVFNDDLWRANQRVTWSWNNFAGVFKGPSVGRGCWVSITWSDCRLDKKWIHELHNPHRWQMFAKWTMISNGANLLVDHDHPYIYMTIFARNPQEVSYTASCGC